MFALAALITFTVGFVLDVLDVTNEATAYVLAGLALLALHLVLGDRWPNRRP